MPSPITHTVFAQRMLRHPRFQNLDARAVIVGTNLPDARNAGTVQSRDVTHNNDVTLEEVFGYEDSFTLGFWFHSWVDVFHADYFKTYADFDMYYGNRRISLAWKTIEDEMLMTLLDDHDTVASYFVTVPEDALTYGVPEGDVAMWFGILHDYFTHPQEEDEARRILEALGLKSKNIAEILELAQKFRDDPVFAKHIDSIIERFDEALGKS